VEWGGVGRSKPKRLQANVVTVNINTNTSVNICLHGGGGGGVRFGDLVCVRVSSIAYADVLMSRHRN